MPTNIPAWLHSSSSSSVSSVSSSSSSKHQQQQHRSISIRAALRQTIKIKWLLKATSYIAVIEAHIGSHHRVWEAAAASGLQAWQSSQVELSILVIETDAVGVVRMQYTRHISSVKAVLGNVAV